MEPWNSSQYLRYQTERTRPAIDLARRIQLAAPQTIVDLGCGPGNSTNVLRGCWPDASICGVDNSEAMLEAARAAYPDIDWQLGDICNYRSLEPVNLIFSNAAFQWVAAHRKLLEQLSAQVAAGGALAFQIPSQTFAVVRTLIHEIATDGGWSVDMQPALAALTMESPASYFDWLAPHANSIDLWETEYFHVLPNREAIIEWIRTTGLRPFLDVLPSADAREQFVQQLRLKLDGAYPLTTQGTVLFPFRRTFVIAYL